MKIAGLEPCSFCDYKGKLAAVVFTQGCNLRCPFCHNAELIRNPGHGDGAFSQEQVLQFLVSRKGRLDAVVVSGGEPTLQSGLSDFLREIRALGYSTKLDTNGTQPEVVESLLSQGLLDFIAMDIKAPWHRYDELTGVRTPLANVKRSTHAVAESGVEHEFRTTFVPGLLNENDLAAIRNLIPPGSPWITQQYHRHRSCAGAR
jgi:pyruvate formate lyase activating enzyme